jgi:hypothetical protein
MIAKSLALAMFPALHSFVNVPQDVNQFLDTFSAKATGISISVVSANDQINAVFIRQDRHNNVFRPIPVENFVDNLLSGDELIRHGFLPSFLWFVLPYRAMLAALRVQSQLE